MHAYGLEDQNFLLGKKMMIWVLPGKKSVHSEALQSRLTGGGSSRTCAV